MEIALTYLNQNPLLHMGMIVPIKRGTAQIFYEGGEGVLLKEENSSAYMISVSTHKDGMRLMEMIPKDAECDAIVTFHQEFMQNDFKAKIRHTTFLENYQAVYFSENPLPILSGITIKALDIRHFELITENYDVDVGADYLRKRIEKNELFGGYERDELVGFAGIHAEGSIGLLKVFEQHRGKGYGKTLTAYMVNHQLACGITPFMQIGTDNAASLAVARGLNFAISKERVYWMF